MAGLVYFVPSRAAELVEGGRLRSNRLPGSLGQVLWDALEVPQQLVVSEVQSGPQSQAGSVLYPVPPHGECPPGLGYFPDIQRWRFCGVETNGYWLGSLRDSPPRPTDLERSQMLSGWVCLDGCHQKWIVPIIRSPNNGCGNLPWEVTFDSEDRPRFSVAGRWRRLWEEAETLWDWALTRGRPNHEGLMILGEGFTESENQFLLECAFNALAINYRVDRHVLAALTECSPGWLTGAFASLVCNAMVDFRAKLVWDAAQKKTGSRSAPGGVSFSPGGEDSCPDSAPAAESLP